MIDTKELRRLAQAAIKGPWVVDEVGVGFEIAAGDNVIAQAQSIPRDSIQHAARRANAAFIAAANPAAISELLDRLEAAEKEIALKERVIDALGSELNAVVRVRDALLTKIEQMEKQEPAGTALLCTRCSTPFDGDHYCPACGYHTATEENVYALPGAQPIPNLDMDAVERQNDDLKAEVGRLRDALALIADQYEPKCSLLIPSIARTALNATGAYGQKESPESWPTEAMVTAFAELFNVRDQKNTFGPAFRAALAAAPEAKP